MNKTWKFALAGLLLVGMTALGLHNNASAQMAVGEKNPFRGILQGQPIAGILRTDSTARLMSMDGSGNLYVTWDKDRDNWRLYPNVINNQLNSTTAGVDSSQAMDTHDMKKLWLVLYGQFDSLSTTVRLAVQIRGHYNTASDSGSAYPWVRWPIPRPATPISIGSVLYSASTAALHMAAAAASRGTFTTVPNGYQVVGQCIQPGTYVVSHSTSDSGLVLSTAGAAFDGTGTYTFYPPGTLQPSNNAQADSIGDIVIGVSAVAQTTEANSVIGTSGMWPGEFMTKFSISQRDSVSSGAGKYGGSPHGMWIPLQDYQGVPFQAPYMSVRIRVINGVRSRFRIRADVVGSSL